MTEELKVVLRRSEHSGFGFSLLGTTGPPHVIFDIVENSPAADCGAVEAGDIIVKVNGTDVHRYTTKEVLKCLRLSEDLVTLELKRDPKLKARIKEQLANTTSPHYVEIESPNIYDCKSRTSPTYSQALNANDTQISNMNMNVSPTASSAASRYKSSTPTSTHLPTNRQISTANHSRSSSASSANIQFVEINPTTNSTTNASTSPTCRPSRIPTALKCSQKASAQHSPQHKRPRPSQIPTKALTISTIAAANGNPAPSVTAPIAPGAHNLQHSNSYSGSTRNNQQQVTKEQNSEPNSAPPQPAKAPRFEAYMMTGDLILNLSRTPQSSNFLSAHAKKIDSLRDSPNRVTISSRPNGALAPRASGESSPTSSSSVDSPTHTASSADSLYVQKHREKSKHNQVAGHVQLMQQQRDSINNSYNNSNSGGERQYRKDSLTNDTLLLCEDLERDDEDEAEDILEEEEEEIHTDIILEQESSSIHRHYQRHTRYHRERNYEKVGEVDDVQENEEDQTHYDITNIETYNSGGVVDNTQDDEASDRQYLVANYGDDEDLADNEDFSTNSLTSLSTKQRLRALKQKAILSRYKSDERKRIGNDSVDSTRPHQYYGAHISGSSSSSATVKSDVIGVNTSQDDTSFSVPTSPISLSTPLLEKETANSVPTSPEPSSIGAVAGGSRAVTGGLAATHDTTGVVRRHNGIVRKCDSAGFRTSKSEDHLQQIQRDGIAAVIPIDIDEDVNSSLNTLLDTRQDSEDSQASNRDRIVWTYNAPLTPHQLAQHQPYPAHYSHNSSPNSHSSSLSSSPHNSVDSPASPTSVSSSVMSSSGSKGALGINSNYNGNHLHQQQLLHSQQMQTNANGNGMITNTTTSGTTGTTQIGLLQCSNGSGGGGANIVVGIGSGLSSSVGGGCTGGDHSVSEAISNISSPDYQDDDNLLSSRDILGGMVLSDPSDSDSTILVSDAPLQRQQKQQQTQQQLKQQQQKSQQSEHKLVIQVRGVDSSNSTSPRSAYSELKDSEDELGTLTEEPPTTVLANVGGGVADGRDSSPPVSDDGSDVESLHSYHYSPKAVDMPSAIRLAKRLYSLDGFKKSDVSRHLSKNNDFSRAVADEYLKYFSFENKTLDQSLREFLQQFSLSGETQERERVLVHFSKRFLDCNPGSFNSQDAVHTLTCAIMLLNTDLHGQNVGRKMTCTEFVDNLAELNDGENFPKDVLKHLYQAIKSQPLEWALDDDDPDLQKQRTDNSSTAIGSHLGQNPFLDLPESSTAIEYKKGYVMRKCCYDSNFKKTPFGKRSWKMFYCTLRDLVLFLHKDEHGFRKNQMSDNLHNAIRIHHALATKATDYTKKQHVFRLQTADQAEYLFQTSDSKELQSWIETINFVCAAYSAPPLEGGVGSQKRFQRPLLPSTHTKFILKEQVESHELQLLQIENVLSEHKKNPIPTKGLPLQNFKEKENYLQYELRRYKMYVSILNSKLLADQQKIELQLNVEETDTFPMGGRLQQQQQQQQSNSNSIITQQQQQQQPPDQQQPQKQQTANRKKEKKK